MPNKLNKQPPRHRARVRAHVNKTDLTYVSEKICTRYRRVVEADCSEIAVRVPEITWWQRLTMELIDTLWLVLTMHLV